MATLLKSRPNGWFLALRMEGDVETGGVSDNAFFYVVETGDETGDEDGTEFYDDAIAAIRYYDERRAELADTRNWEMQERYDEEHGTDNGYAFECYRPSDY